MERRRLDPEIVGRGGRGNEEREREDLSQKPKEYPNSIKATVLDSTGKLTIGSVTLNLPAKAWGQTAITSVVSDGYVQFDPSDSAVCYAVVVDNSTNDGQFISAAEYRP